MSELKKFRLINKIEGYSFLILLFIAMPLKHIASYPIATKIMGMIHGVLFIAFIYQLFMTKEEAPLSAKETALFFLLSLVPFGTFYTESICKKKD